MRFFLFAASMVIVSSEAASAAPAIAADGTFVPQSACSSLSAGAVKYSAAGLASGRGAEPNTLLKDEAQGNWHLLFDGKSLQGWRGFQRTTIPPAWHVSDGALMVTRFVGEIPTSDRGDIRTVDAFDNFELRLQWAVSPGANSGVLYFVREGVANKIWQTAPEMQVLDDAHHEDGIELSHRAGGLYDIYPPRCDALKPPGEYNDVRLVVRSGHVEHWLNGYLVLEYELDSPDLRARVARSKFRDFPQFGRAHSGYLALQDHGDVVRFRSIRARKF
ncbi:MAG: DUF1080 domain-containing protein [Proteobacteria bacterium]|nr:DUF1080 domain-containing protein [Pseudomonadota bacterium]